MFCHFNLRHFFADVSEHVVRVVSTFRQNRHQRVSEWFDGRHFQPRNYTQSVIITHVFNNESRFLFGPPFCLLVFGGFQLPGRRFGSHHSGWKARQLRALHRRPHPLLPPLRVPHGSGPQTRSEPHTACHFNVSIEIFNQ